jgi:guanidinopropionase
MNRPSHDAMTQRVRGYSKFMDIKPSAGIATFFRTNLCEDWSAINVAPIGLPTDIGLTQRTGARPGPREISNQSRNVL